MFDQFLNPTGVFDFLLALIALTVSIMFILALILPFIVTVIVTIPITIPLYLLGLTDVISLIWIAGTIFGLIWMGQSA